LHAAGGGVFLADKTMTNLTLRKDLLVQRDLLLDQYPSIEEAIKDEAYVLPESDEPVLLISDHGKLYELNLVAAFIWEKLTLQLPLSQIVDDLISAFEVSRVQAEGDLDGFLRFLKHIPLIDPQPEATSGGTA
jgi:hypothetical protein